MRATGRLPTPRPAQLGSFYPGVEAISVAGCLIPPLLPYPPIPLCRPQISRNFQPRLHPSRIVSSRTSRNHVQSLRAYSQVGWGAGAKSFSFRHTAFHATAELAGAESDLRMCRWGLRGNFAGKTWGRRFMHRRQASRAARIVAGSPTACKGGELCVAQTHAGRVGMSGTDLAITLQ